MTGDWACTYKVASGVSNLIGSASAHFADLKSDISKIREVSKKKSESASSPIDAHSVWGIQIKKAPAVDNGRNLFSARLGEGLAQTFLESEPKRGYEVILCHRVVRYGHLIAGADDQVFPFG